MNEVSSLTYAPVAKTDVDLFERLYIPAFDHIFEMLDLDNFHKWAYSCAISGNTVLSASVYENIGEITSFIMSRPKHKEYTSWDSLIQNLGLLLNDLKLYSLNMQRKLVMTDIQLSNSIRGMHPILIMRKIYMHIQNMFC